MACPGLRTRTMWGAARALPFSAILVALVAVVTPTAGLDAAFATATDAACLGNVASVSVTPTVGGASTYVRLTPVSSDPSGLSLPLTVTSSNTISLRKAVDAGTFEFDLTVVEGAEAESITLPLRAVVSCAGIDSTDPSSSTATLRATLAGFSTAQFTTDGDASARVADLEDSLARGLGVDASAAAFVSATDAANGVVVECDIDVPADMLAEDKTLSMTLDASPVAGVTSHHKLAFDHAARTVARAIGVCCSAVVGIACDCAQEACTDGVCPLPATAYTACTTDSDCPAGCGTTYAGVCGPHSWSSLQSATDTADMLIWWPLNEASGTAAADWSPSSNAGTINGSPTFDSEGIVFNGGNVFIESASNLGLSGDAEFTFSVWWKWAPLTHSAHYPGIMGLDPMANSANQGLMIIAHHGQAGMDYRDMSTLLSTAPTTQTWHHMVVTKAAGTKNANTLIYVDGVVATHTQNGDDSAPAIVDNTFYVGRTTNAANRYWDGYINDVRVYNRVLTAQEVQDIYDATAGLHA
eukprot:CAMPEP_0203821606 /NCGR_PEP_ID=MMETSP0115-20131106/43671_1 /ASSEMBLY_ACC=CAM_ASM_000227 /TAXON_ID=33651 /ORGANISM="Bicosoecid sp, Strain ms1" /LENGTH=525 /DNA_ID=CAMNT_0050730631 /DNA_START=39 /DNA_END=1616 /DNA_ORIENTATION=+